MVVQISAKKVAHVVLGGNFNVGIVWHKFLSFSRFPLQIQTACLENFKLTKNFDA